jgi:predicted metal-binding transcription factor (methanogenesis marker protein 9)
MGIVSDKRCSENQNKHFVFSSFFPPKSCPVHTSLQELTFKAEQFHHMLAGLALKFLRSGHAVHFRVFAMDFGKENCGYFLIQR